MAGYAGNDRKLLFVNQFLISWIIAVYRFRYSEWGVDSRQLGEDKAIFRGDLNSLNFGQNLMFTI
jgi:hypothetical protein